MHAPECPDGTVYSVGAPLGDVPVYTRNELACGGACFGGSPKSAYAVGAVVAPTTFMAVDIVDR